MSFIYLGVKIDNDGNDSALEQCITYSGNGADVILRQDAAADDASHDRAVGIIKQAVQSTDSRYVI